MEIIKVNSHVLEMDNRIDEMVYHKYMMYNMNIMLESGVGSDINAFGERLQEIATYAAKGDMEGMNKVIGNIQACYTFMMQGMSPEMNAFVWMIRKIDGEEVGELTDEKIKLISRQLSAKGLTVGKVKGFLKRLKKKLKTDFQVLLPKWVDKTDQKYFVKLKQRTDLVLRKILGEDVGDKIKKIEDDIFGMSTPKEFIGKNAVHIKSFMNYNTTSAILKQNRLGDTKVLTVVEFYNALDILKKQLKPRKK